MKKSVSLAPSGRPTWPRSTSSSQLVPVRCGPTTMKSGSRAGRTPFMTARKARAAQRARPPVPLCLLESPTVSSSREILARLHIVDDCLAELRALEQLRAGHQALEVVGHLFLVDGRLKPANDAVGNLLPSHVLEHQDARQDNRARVHLVLVGVLGCGAVGRLE